MSWRNNHYRDFDLYQSAKSQEPFYELHREDLSLSEPFQFLKDTLKISLQATISWKLFLNTGPCTTPMTVLLAGLEGLMGVS